MAETYFMNPEDRMIIDLLHQYAFVLHEDVKDLTDEEIDFARNFATKYLEKNTHYKRYDQDFTKFVNKQTFKALTNQDYELIEKEIYQKVLEVNNLVNIYDWDIDIYYDIDYGDKLLLSRINKDGYHDKINLIYNFKYKSFCSCNIKISDEMYELGNIHYNSYSIDELNNIKI